jgi:glycosyltransferase involved in cell wall biosynthesis
VLTSERETFGVVLIEALAAGLPVIATRAGGPEEIVTSEVGGIVDGDDQAQLVAALRAAPGNVARWGARCEAFARERYDYAVVGARVAGVLRRALAL